MPSSPAAFFQAPDAALTGTTCAAIITGAGKVTAATGNIVDAQACVLQARLGLASYASAVALYNQDLAAVSSNLGVVPRSGDQTINLPKLDWQINAKHHASFLFNRLRWDSPGGVQTQATNTYGVDGFGNDFVKLDYGLARLDSVLTSTITNEVRYQYGRELNDETAQPTSAYDAQFVNGTSYQGEPPSISLQSTNGFTSGVPYYSFRPAYPDERKWQAADTVNWVRGQHNFKFGGDIVHNYDIVNSLSLAAQTPNGGYTYQYLGNFFADLAKPSGSCGSGATEYNVGALPCYSTYGQNFGQAAFDIATTDYGFFFQDNWKLTPKLVVDLGIRYDYQSVPGPYQALIQPTSTYTPLPQFSQKPSDKNNIGPRVGFAYDAFGKGTTVVRGGFGMFYGRMLNATLLGAYSSTGSPLAQIGVTFRNNQGGPSFPSILAPTFTPTALAAPNVQYFDKNFQNPQALEYDLTVQQQFGPSTVLSVSYLASLGRELPNFINTNLINTPAANNNAANGKGYTTVNYTVAGTGNCGPLACGSTYATKVYNGYANPAFQAVTDITSNINSSYNALVFELANKTNKYASFDLSYTWSHALDDNQNESTQASTNQLLDPNAPLSSQYGDSAFNVPNRFIGYATLQYPKRFSGLASTVLDGWNLNPIVQLQNGLPYSLVTSGYGSGAAILAGWDGAGAPAASSYIPEVGRNSFTLRRTEVFDARLEKQFQLHDKYTLQLFGECFNIFNHENYTSANTTGYNFGSTTLANSATTYTGPQTYTTALQYNTSFGSTTNANSNYVYSPRQVQVAAKLVF
ncbi:TonB-dependent receptor [Acidipila sp. EB88]|uniref:TonB-dependent receptor n=1 Tax=Acidipila sp. EB88 TaxID=2305226 RepID=UPI000F5D9CBE|nr:TonB-dependent receptor [Acidipila sp. EB88]